MSDPRLATRALPSGVTATPTWGEDLRDDGTPIDRFLLTWTHPARTGPPNLVIGMNPSGASAEAGDLTLLKVWEFCRRWNDGSLIMGNVNPYRATEPRQQRFHIASLATNRRILVEQMRLVRDAKGLVVAAWGCPPPMDEIDADKWYYYADLLHAGARSLGIDPMCLGTTKHGHPRHPSRIGYDTQLVTWSPR